MRYSTVGWDLGNLQLLIPAYRSVLLVFPLNSLVAHSSLQSVYYEPQLVEFSLPVYQVALQALNLLFEGLANRQKTGPVNSPTVNRGHHLY